MDCSPPGSSVHGILQARILQWVAMPSSKGSSQPRDQSHISDLSCIDKQILQPVVPPGKPIYTILSPEAEETVLGVTTLLGSVLTSRAQRGLRGPGGPQLWQDEPVVNTWDSITSCSGPRGGSIDPSQQQWFFFFFFLNFILFFFFFFYFFWVYMSSPSPSPAVVLNGDLPRAQNSPAMLCSQAQIVTCQINLKKKIAKKKTDLKKKRNTWSSISIISN